jgi:hypothetical protein
MEIKKIKIQQPYDMTCFAPNLQYRPCILQYTAYALHFSGEAVKITAFFRYSLNDESKSIWCKIRAFHKTGEVPLPLFSIMGKMLTSDWQSLSDNNEITWLQDTPHKSSLSAWFVRILPNLNTLGYQLIPESYYHYYAALGF